MCFSATASFVTAGGLTPIGASAIDLARRRDPGRWLPLAVTPLLFGCQQALDGLVWLALDPAAPGEGLLRPAALAYLGFAFAFWSVWMPWCALALALAFGLAQLSQLADRHAFSSVWSSCSAVLSVLVLWVLAEDGPLVTPGA